MPLSSQANLGHIAEQAKVSRTTVSLALRNSPKISAATRARVRTAARKLGYRPNPLVSAQMAYVRTMHPQASGLSIGFVCNHSLSEMKIGPLTPLRKTYFACRARAQALGYQLELFNLGEPGMTEQRLSQIMIARGMRGVIVNPLNESAALPRMRFDIRHFASVMIEHAFLEPRLHKVCDDNFSTIGRLIQKMLDSGYRRIGIAMPRRMDEHANHQWLAGYQTYQALCDPAQQIPHFITADWSQESFLAWHARHRPEAIITVDDDLVAWLRAGGVKVPKEVACATLYWMEERSYLSGFYQDHEVSGTNAVDLIVAQLYHNECGVPKHPKTVLCDAVWKPGSTLPSRAKSGFRSPLRIWKR